MYAATVARILYAQKWKEGVVPTKEEWQIELMAYVEVAGLTNRIRD